MKEIKRNKKTMCRGAMCPLLIIHKLIIYKYNYMEWFEALILGLIQGVDRVFVR